MSPGHLWSMRGGLPLSSYGTFWGPLLALLLLNTFLSVHTYLSQFKLREDLQELREDVEDLQELGGGV